MNRASSTDNKPRNGYQTLIFDLDGTISDPGLGFYRSINFALNEHGHSSQLPAALSRFIGPPLDQTFATLAQTRDEAMVAALVASYRERYARIGYAENTLYDGIPALFRTLAAAPVVLGVCSSKRQDFVEQILTLHGLDTCFQFIGGGDTGISKSTQLADLVTQHQIDTETAVMIGDRKYDVSAAHDNGIAAAAVLWGYGSQAELAPLSPRHLVAEVADIGLLVDAT